MKMRARQALIVVLACSTAAAGCRDVEGGDGSDERDAGAPDASGGAAGGETVRELKGGEVEIGQAVELGEVVVTGIERERDHFYVQDRVEEAEPYNGIFVFRGNDPPALAEELEVGSVVDVGGELAVHDGATQIVVPAGEEIARHEGENAEPVVVDDPPPLEDLVDVEAGEPYEHVVVEIANVEFDEHITDFGDIRVRSGDVELVVDNQLLGVEFFEDYVDEESLAAGDCFATLRGIMDRVDFTGPERRIYPRDEEDFEIDDGQACADPVEARSVQDLKREEGVEEGDEVRVEGAVVTFIPDDGEGHRMFIQDELDEGAEAFNGILVFLGQSGETTSVPEEAEIGSYVDVSGELGEFGGASQITSDVSVELREQEPADPSVLTEDLDLEVLADPGDDGDPYEHVLIELQDVEVVGESGGGDPLVGDGEGGELIIDEFFMHGELDVSEGDCFEGLPGVMDRTEIGPQPDRRLRLRDGDELELGGDCD